MNIGGHRGEKEACETAHGEESDKPKGVEHRSLIGDRAFIESGGPIEDFDRGGNGDRKAERGKNKSSIDGLPRHKHMVAPDEKADHRDGQAGISNEDVAERLLPGKTGD